MWPLQDPGRLCQVSLLNCWLSVKHHTARKILYTSTQMSSTRLANVLLHYSAVASLCVPQTIEVDMKEKNSLR